MGTPPGAWCYSVSAGTGQPGVSILWLGDRERLVCNFYLSVAARKIEQIHPWDTLACCRDVKQPTNKPPPLPRLPLTYYTSLYPSLSYHTTPHPPFSSTHTSPNLLYQPLPLSLLLSYHPPFSSTQTSPNLLYQPLPLSLLLSYHPPFSSTQTSPNLLYQPLPLSLSSYHTTPDPRRWRSLSLMPLTFPVCARGSGVLWRSMGQFRCKKAETKQGVPYL